MFYVTDFRIKKTNKIIPHTKPFSVTISNNVVHGKEKFSKYSLVVAAKPFIYFASIFGSKFITYSKNYKIQLLNKLYSFMILVLYLGSIFLLAPSSWRKTKIDVPLNVLTKTYRVTNIAEITYSFFSVAILNTESYVKLFQILDDIDFHFDISERLFWRRRIISMLMVLMPTVQVTFSFWLRQFNIHNIGAHMMFFFILLHGLVLGFTVLNIYVKLIMLNILLMKRVKETLSNSKKIILQDTICDRIIKVICIEPKLVQEKVINCCWFELMKIYDELADCIHIFNKVYCGQIFVIYNIWLLSTMLIICRFLSPSLKHSQVLLSDLFIYSCIHCRPLLLASAGEMFIRERKKTLAMLMHILLTSGKNDAYVSQVRTMIMLVASRKLEISANVFAVNVPTVMNFTGRIISYTVLMIQYFYSHAIST